MLKPSSRRKQRQTPMNTIQIEMPEQLETLIQRHPYFRHRKTFIDHYRRALLYFTIKDAYQQGTLTNTIQSLNHWAKQTSISKETLRRWILDIVRPRLITNLIKHEHARHQHEVQLATTTHTHRLDPADVYQVLYPLHANPNQQIPHRFATAIAQLRAKKPEPFVIFAELFPYHDRGPLWLRTLATIIHKQRKAIEIPLNQQLKEANVYHHIGVVNNTLYLWRQTTHPYDWLTMCAHEYFHFKKQAIKNQLMKDALQHLRLFTERQLSHLTLQLTSYKGKLPKEGPIADLHHWRPYLHGTTLHLLLATTNQTLTNIQPYFIHLGKLVSGGGIISKPKFPHGMELREIQVRLLALMLSDGHLTEKRHAIYYENDRHRLKRVLVLFRKIGDIELSVIKDERNLTKVHIPAIVGRLLERWGMPVGDRSIHNHGLPKTLFHNHLQLCQIYLQELIPEDGCFHRSGSTSKFKVGRSVVLNAGLKEERYNFDSKIPNSIISFIHQFGNLWISNPRQDHNIEAIQITWKAIRDLARKNIAKISKPAQQLERIIKTNPSKLLLDEIHLCKKLGIEMSHHPTRILFFPNTGRVSVGWNAYTKSITDTLRFALISPPNDYRKRALVKKFLIDYFEQVLKITDQIIKEWSEKDTTIFIPKEIGLSRRTPENTRVRIQMY